MSARIALLHILHMATERGGAAVADCFESLSLIEARLRDPISRRTLFRRCGRHRPLRADVLSFFLWSGTTNKIDRIQAFQRTLRGANGAVGEVEIACRSSEMRVSQQSLDHEQVHAFVQQMGRESVTPMPHAA